MLMLMTVASPDDLVLTAEEMEAELEDKRRTIKAPCFSVVELAERPDLAASQGPARLGVPTLVHWALSYGKAMVTIERGSRAMHERPFSYWRQLGAARMRETLCGARVETVATDQLDRKTVLDAGPHPVCNECLERVQARVLAAVEGKARRVLTEVRDGMRVPDEVHPLIEDRRTPVPTPSTMPGSGDGEDFS